MIRYQLFALLAGFFAAHSVACKSPGSTRNPEREGIRIAAIATGETTTCAVFENGKAACVGIVRNLTTAGLTSLTGKAASETDNLEIPFAVKQLVLARGSKGLHACALSTEGKVFCWGANTRGEAGAEAEQTILRGLAEKHGVPLKQLQKLRPVSLLAEMQLPAQARAITAGYAHSCALLVSGDVYCWGENVFGQLGLGARRQGHKTDNSATPQPVSLFSAEELKRGLGATEIASGHNHICALISDGTVRCWGDNGFGQAGHLPRYEGSVQHNTVIGTFYAPADAGNVPVLSPEEMANGLKVRSVAAGGDRSCAILTNGAVRCWGENRFQKLGFVSDFDKISLVRTPAELGNVPLPPGIIRLALGQIHTCAVSDQGKVYCWGDNANGQLGTPGIGSGARLTMPPAAVKLAQPPETLQAREVAVGTDHSCALMQNGKMRCWGLGFNGQLGTGNGKKFGKAGCMNGVPYCLGDEDSELPPPDVEW